MNKFRHVALVVTLCGVGLLESVGHASDFGLIHFYGSVLYSGCYILGTQSQTPTVTAFDQDGKVVNFGMRFKYCRLVDRGQVLADVSVVHPSWDNLRMLQSDGCSRLLKPIKSEESISRFSLKGFLNEFNQLRDTSFEFRQKNLQHLLIDSDIGLEIIYR